MSRGDAAYHASVRHYHSPLPLSHRNARAFPSPDSNLGPWGASAATAGNAAVRYETSALSKTYDRRNQSRVPLSTGLPPDQVPEMSEYSFANSQQSPSASSRRVHADPTDSVLRSTPLPSAQHQRNLGSAVTLADYHQLQPASDSSPQRAVPVGFGETQWPEAMGALDSFSPMPRLASTDAFETSRKQFPERWADSVPLHPNQASGNNLRMPSEGSPRPARATLYPGQDDEWVANASASSYQATIGLGSDPSVKEGATSGSALLQPGDGSPRSLREWNGDGRYPLGIGLSRSSPFHPRAQPAPMPTEWKTTSYGPPVPRPVSTGMSPRRRAPARVPVGYINKSTNVPGATFVQMPMGYRALTDRPQIPAKVTQYCPWKPMEQQLPLPTLEPRAERVERLPATPLIVEVEERLAAQGLGSLLQVRHASDEKLTKLLATLGFGPTDRMTILWALRMKHPS